MAVEGTGNFSRGWHLCHLLLSSGSIAESLDFLFRLMSGSPINSKVVHHLGTIQ